MDSKKPQDIHVIISYKSISKVYNVNAYTDMNFLKKMVEKMVCSKYHIEIGPGFRKFGTPSMDDCTFLISINGLDLHRMEKQERILTTVRVPLLGTTYLPEYNTTVFYLENTNHFQSFVDELLEFNVSVYKSKNGLVCASGHFFVVLPKKGGCILKYMKTVQV